MHYHRGCSVSLPCSEWERVGPLRDDHQKAGEAEVSPRGDGGGLTLNFTRNSDDQSIKLWLEAADHMDQQKLTTLIQRVEVPRAPSTPDAISRDRINMLPESGHYQLRWRLRF
jgi:hypothetical protein